jgi:hypothetical protein
MEGPGSGERIIAHLGFARAVAARSLDPRCRGADREDLIAWGVVGLVQAGCTIRRLRMLPGGRRTLPASAARTHVRKVLLRLDHRRGLEPVVCCRRAAIPMAQPVHESGDERAKDERYQGEGPQLFHGPQPIAWACGSRPRGVDAQISVAINDA